jgi:hypothetical protein
MKKAKDHHNQPIDRLVLLLDVLRLRHEVSSENQLVKPGGATPSANRKELITVDRHAKRGQPSRLTYRICKRDHNNWNTWSL